MLRQQFVRSRYFSPLLLALIGLLILGLWINNTWVEAASVYIVDNSTTADNRPSIAILNGKPIISYFDVVSNNLMMAACSDISCTTFGNTVRLVDGATERVGDISAIGVANGNPVIAYRDMTHSNLRFAVCSDATCSTPTITTLDSTTGFGYNVSMVMANGNPVISYTNTGNPTTLKIAVCSDPTCTTAPTLRVIDTLAGIGPDSITVTDTGPVISYYDQANLDLKVAICSDMTCSGSITLKTIDSTTVYGYSNAIAVVDGNPIISYAGSGGSLKVAACTDPICAAAPTITTLPITFNWTWGIALANINGLPVIAFNGTVAESGGLVLATCADTACTTASFTALESIGQDGLYPAMTSLNNQPAIAYLDQTNSRIKYYYGGTESTYGLTTTPTPTTTITPTLEASVTSTPVGQTDIATPPAINSVVDTLISKPGSLQLDASGIPLLVYVSDSLDLKLARCNSRTSCDTPTRHTLTTLHSTPTWYISLALSSTGIPFIGFDDNNQVKFARCSDAACTTSTLVTVANTTGAADYLSLALDSSDIPIISYYDFTTQTVQLVRCNNNTTCDAPTNSLIASAASSGGYISLALDAGGIPFIAYYNGNSHYLELARCNNNTTCDAPVITPIEYGGTQPSLRLDSSGKPVIAYRLSTLRIAYCNSVACDAPLLATVDGVGTGDYASLRLDTGDIPVISYYDSQNTNLKLARCNNNTTCDAPTRMILASIGQTGLWTSLALDEGSPIISYYYADPHVLKMYFGNVSTAPTPTPTLTDTPTPTLTDTPTPTLTKTPTPTLYPTPAAVGTLISNTSGNADDFGYAVAVSGDTIVVGAPNHDPSGLTDAGAAYVYQWNGTIWAQQAELLASDAAAGDQFGVSVGIYDDTVIAGAFGDDDAGASSGAAYVFTRSGTTWTQQQKLTAPDAAAGESFGQSVAISIDSVIIGANGDDQAAVDAGAAYVFTRSGTTWTQQQKLTAGDPLTGAQFGFAVDLYADTAVVGAPLPTTVTGSAYVFVRNGGVWTQQQKLSPSASAHSGDGFGWSVAVYNDSAAVGSPYAQYSGPTTDDGWINVYNRVNGVWTIASGYAVAIPSALPTGAPYATPQLGGYAVDTYRESFLAGAPYMQAFHPGPGAGGALVMGKMPNYITVDTIASTPSNDGERFGWAVARDGSVVVVGAPAADYDSLVDPGAAYIFSVPAPPWEPTASQTPSLTPSPTLTPSMTLTPSATPPSPTAPANATPIINFFGSDMAVLTWNRVAGAMGYRVEIDDAADFRTPVDGHDLGADETYYTTPSLSNGTYYWRVCAKNSAGVCGRWSTVQSFVISAPPPTPPSGGCTDNCT